MREVRAIATWVTTVLVAIGVGVGVEGAIGAGMHIGVSNALLTGDKGPCAGQPPGCASPLGTAAALAAGSWSTFPAGPLSARSGQVEVWTGHELIVWGGMSPEGAGPLMPGNGGAYDPSSNTW